MPRPPCVSSRPCHQDRDQERPHDESIKEDRDDEEERGLIEDKLRSETEEKATEEERDENVIRKDSFKAPEIPFFVSGLLTSEEKRRPEKATAIMIPVTW